MGYYTIRPNKEDLNPLGEIGNRELTTWCGVKNESLGCKYITDGTIFVDKKHVDNHDLFDKLCDRKSDESIDTESVDRLINQLKNENQESVKILGQIKASRVGMGSVSAKWVAIVKYDSNKYELYDASAVDIVNKLLDNSGKIKIGPSSVLTWWKYGVPVGGVASWEFYDVEFK